MWRQAIFLSIQRILFATDFSESAQDAQQYAMALAQRLGAELHLLHVVPFSVSSYEIASPYSVLENETETLTNVAHEQLEGLIDPTAVQGLRIEKAVVTGTVVDEILKYADAHHIALIVVGTHGHTGLSRLLIGSVAEKIVRLAKCPVLTVHPKDRQFLM